jgi:hypothetical protein
MLTKQLNPVVLAAIVIVVVMWAGAMTASAAVTWDAVADFATTQSATSVWQYGSYAEDNSFYRFPNFSSAWGGSWAGSFGGYPDITLNVHYPSMSFASSPGAPSPVLRWQSPVDGYILCTASFTGHYPTWFQPYSTTTQVSMSFNAKDIWNSPVSGSADSQGLQKILHVQPGDTIDFYDAPGGAWNRVDLTVSIMAVPTPLSQITTTTGAPPNTLSNALKPVDTNTTPPSKNLKRWDGNAWQPVESWDDPNIDPNKPTVVLTHGWAPSECTDGLGSVSKLATALFQQDSNANILGWDWTAQAAVTLPGGLPALPGLAGYVEDVIAEGLNGAARCARNGSVQGVSLAHELEALHVNNASLQLIGHSNGAAVVGAAAAELALTGTPVQRITTLDAPNLMLGTDLTNMLGVTVSPSLSLTRVNALQYVHANTASQVEVYYSNGVLGRTAGGFGAPLVDSSANNIFNGRIYPGDLASVVSGNIDHFRITDWYADVSSGTVGSGEFVAGINWAITGTGFSNFTAGDFTEQGLNSHVFGTTSVAEQKLMPLVTRTIDSFEDATDWLGQHATIIMRDAGNAAAQITSGSNGYLWRDVSVPQDASYLTFDLKTETPGASDFLTVTLGDELIYYKSLTMADTDFSTVDPIFIGDFAGQDETLLFTLNHAGDGTPSILLDNITFSAVPEPATLSLLALGGLAILRRRRR